MRRAAALVTLVVALTGAPAAAASDTTITFTVLPDDPTPVTEPVRSTDRTTARVPAEAAIALAALGGAGAMFARATRRSAAE